MIRFSLVFAATLIPRLLPRSNPHPCSRDSAILPFSKQQQFLANTSPPNEAGEGPALVLIHSFGNQSLFDRGRVIKPRKTITSSSTKSA
jgi:hypothetical protein